MSTPQEVFQSAMAAAIQARADLTSAETAEKGAALALAAATANLGRAKAQLVACDGAQEAARAAAFISNTPAANVTGWMAGIFAAAILLGAGGGYAWLHYLAH